MTRKDNSIKIWERWNVCIVEPFHDIIMDAGGSGMDIRTQILWNQIKNEVDRILHMPNSGFYGGQTQERRILEMTLVIDRRIPTDALEAFLPDLVRSLKRHDDVFRDVRMNLVEWTADGTCNNTVVPMLRLTMSGFYEELERERCTGGNWVAAENQAAGGDQVAAGNQTAAKQKTYQNLYAYLKKFHARSRLVILLCAAGHADGDAEEKKKELLPFLWRKLIRIQMENGEITLCCRNDF